MALFRIDPDHPFHGPHQEQPVVTGGPSPSEARLAMILVHGRGASAQGMLELAEEFDQDDIHYRALQAADRTWYPQSFLAPENKNQPGINSGLQALYDQLQELQKEGFSSDQIMLLGFSQGACLTSEFAARHPQRYGGVVALSGGLIGSVIHAESYSGSFENTPVFLGCSARDPHIPQRRVKQTADILQRLGASVTQKIYPDMGHTVNRDEISHIQEMIGQI